jgi:hypothetical protein
MYRSSDQSDLPPIKFNFLQLLRLTRQFEVSDPRDRVYGLLGIATLDTHPENGKHFVKPDYHISKIELWKQVAIKILATTNDLSLLSCVQYQSDKLDVYNGFVLDSTRSWKPPPLPSWVPQWDHVFRTTISAWDHDESFSAAKGLPRQLCTSPATGSLLLQGTKAGVVRYVSELMLERLDLSFLGHNPLNQFFETGTGLLLLASTLTAGMNSYSSKACHNQSVAADLAAYTRLKSWSAINLHHRGADGDAERFEAMALRVCRSRRLFLTANGYVGLGSDAIREGDLVCILGGGDMPFILRQVKEDTFARSLRASFKKFREASNSSHQDQEMPTNMYHLVGECYMEGLMKGEAIESLSAGESLQGPIPPELTLQTIRQNWSGIKKLYVEAPDDLESVGSLPLERAWFDIR